MGLRFWAGLQRFGSPTGAQRRRGQPCHDYCSRRWRSCWAAGRVRHRPCRAYQRSVPCDGLADLAVAVDQHEVGRGATLHHRQGRSPSDRSDSYDLGFHVSPASWRRRIVGGKNGPECISAPETIDDVLCGGELSARGHAQGTTEILARPAPLGFCGGLRPRRLAQGQALLRPPPAPSRRRAPQAAGRAHGRRRIPPTGPRAPSGCPRGGGPQKSAARGDQAQKARRAALRGGPGFPVPWRVPLPGSRCHRRAGVRDSLLLRRGPSRPRSAPLRSVPARALRASSAWQKHEQRTERRSGRERW